MAKRPIIVGSRKSLMKKPVKQNRSIEIPYESILVELTGLIETARRSAAQTVNSIMTAAYWLIGRRIVEVEQKGQNRAGYGETIVNQLACDLTTQFGRSFAKSNLYQMRAFYLTHRDILQTMSGKRAIFAGADIFQTVSGKSQTLSAETFLRTASTCFGLPWSAYVRLLSVKNDNARRFYETEALHGGWSVRQLARQIDTQFYERTALSKNKAAMLCKGQKVQPPDMTTPEEEIKDPYVLEFLGLKDEYSESDLEDALIRHLEIFLMELGGDFCFVGRQKRLRIGDQWYRMDLVFFHRRLRCLVIIDLKIGRFTHADAGQMHLYLNYAREHWMLKGENPPVGLILCAQKDEAVAHYALENLPSKVMASEYITALPDEKALAIEIERTREKLRVSRKHNLPSPLESESRRKRVTKE
jgi:predicted nuclease of restriction endonuclease-like (RecB) superfamily